VESLQNLDGATLFIIAVGLALLCGVGVVLLIATQVLGNVVGLFTSILGVFFNIAEGGPASWCGCLVLIGGCIVCGGLALVLAQTLSTCGTPNAVNFCGLFGR
jgi:hypothetical protein